MAITEQQVSTAEARMQETRHGGYAVAARYDRRASRIVVRLNSGLELAFPAGLAEGLADASPDDLAEIEISPAGLGLHWPKLDADLYIPSLLQGGIRLQELDGPAARRFGRPGALGGQNYRGTGKWPQGRPAQEDSNRVTTRRMTAHQARRLYMIYPGSVRIRGRACHRACDGF